MKKTILATLVSSLLIGCGGGGDSKPAPSNPDTPNESIPWTPIEPSEPDTSIPWTPIEPSKPDTSIPWTPIEPSKPIEFPPVVEFTLEEEVEDGTYTVGESVLVRANFSDKNGNLRSAKMSVSLPDGTERVELEDDISGNIDGFVQSVVLSQHGKHVFKVEVRDESTAVLSMQEIHVEPKIPNNKPTAYSIIPQRSKIGGCYELNGESSSDIDGQQITHNWEIVSAPKNSEAKITNPSAEITSLCPDIGGQYTVSLTVNDGEDDSDAVEKTTIVGTYLSGVYRDDLILSKDRSPYIVAEKVQIASGAELYIGKGIEIHPYRDSSQGGGRRIEIFGSAKVEGSKDKPVILNVQLISGEVGVGIDKPTIQIDRAIIGPNSFPDVGSEHTNITVTDSVVDTDFRQYVWYPDTYRLERNVFNKNAAFEIGISQRDVALFENNLFKGALEIKNWASYYNIVVVKNNTFEVMPKFEHQLSHNSANMTVAENYWPTTDEDKIQEAILDNNDDLNRHGVIEYLPLLTEPHELTPKQ